jgi:hypothetical protein
LQHQQQHQQQQLVAVAWLARMACEQHGKAIYACHHGNSVFQPRYSTYSLSAGSNGTKA